MAGVPWGAPAGSIGPRGMDLSPYFQSWQLRQQAQRDWQDQLAQQQAQQRFQQQFGMQQAAQDFNQKMAELELKAGLEGDAFNKDQRVQELELRKQEAARSAEASKAQIDLQTAASGRAQEGLDIEKANIEYQKTRDQLADTERADAKSEKDRLTAEAQAREKAVKDAVVTVETVTLPELTQIVAKRGLRGDAAREEVLRIAKLEAAHRFGNDPDALMAALDRVNAWEDEQFDRAAKERKATLEETEMENQQLAKKLTLEDREQARRDKMTSDAEERTRKREETDARILAKAYESSMDRVMELEKQAMDAETLGDTATAEKLRAQADQIAAKADAMGQKLGLFDE